MFQGLNSIVLLLCVCNPGNQNAGGGAGVVNSGNEYLSPVVTVVVMLDNSRESDGTFKTNLSRRRRKIVASDHLSRFSKGVRVFDIERRVISRKRPMQKNKERIVLLTVS